jgi:hypothetical protein
MLECIAYIASNARVIADDKVVGEWEGKGGVGRGGEGRVPWM